MDACPKAERGTMKPFNIGKLLAARAAQPSGDLFYDAAPAGGLDFPERFGRICECPTRSKGSGRSWRSPGPAARCIPHSGESVSRRV